MAEITDYLQSAIDTLRTPVPTNVGLRSTSMATAIAANKKVTEAAAEQQETISEEMARTERATADYKQGQLDAASAAAITAAADADRASRVASNYDVYATLREAQNQMATQIAAANAAIMMVKPQADAELKTIQQMQSVGLMDDPLEWAYNQIQLPNKIKAYNAVADEINSGQATINQNLNAISAIAAGGEKNIPTLTAAQAAAKTAEAAAKAKVASAVADENLARTTVDFATKNTAAAVAAAGVTINTTQLQQTEAQHQFQAQIQQINLADTKANRMLKTAELQEKLSDTQVEKVLLRKYEQIMGHPEGAMPISAFRRLPKDTQTSIIAIAAGGKYGFGPADALDNMRTLGTGQAMPDTTKNITAFLVQKEKEVMTEINKDVEAMAATKGLSTADKQKERKAKLDERLTLEINKELQNPNSTLFGLATPKEVLATVGLEGGLPSGSLLVPALKSLSETNTPVDIKTVAESIRLAFPNDVREQGLLLAQYAALAKRVTLQASNVTSFGHGIKLPAGVVVTPAARTGNMSDILGVGDLNSKIKLDISNPAEATKYMILISRKPVSRFGFDMESK